MKLNKVVLNIVSVAVVIAGFLFPAKTNASGILYQFETPFPLDPNPAGPAPWIDATFQDVPGGVLLTVTNLGLASGEFLQGNGSGANAGLFFNLDPNYNPNDLAFTMVSQNGNFGTYINTGENAFKADGDGKYDVIFDFSTHNFTAGSSFTYLITGISGLTANSFAYLSAPAGGSGPFYAAAHVMGLPGSDSTWIEPGGGPQVFAVPEPSSIALTAASFGLWAAARYCSRRKV